MVEFFGLKAKKEALEKEIQILTSRRDKKKSKRALEIELQESRDEIANVKHAVKLEKEDIKHMVKMKEARLNIKYREKFIECNDNANKRIKEIEDKYTKKMEGRLQTEVDRMEKKYTEIMQLVPKIKVNLDGKP